MVAAAQPPSQHGRQSPRRHAEACRPTVAEGRTTQACLRGDSAHVAMWAAARTHRLSAIGTCTLPAPRLPPPPHALPSPPALPRLAGALSRRLRRRARDGQRVRLGARHLEAQDTTRDEGRHHLPNPAGRFGPARGRSLSRRAAKWQVEAAAHGPPLFGIARQSRRAQAAATQRAMGAAPRRPTS